MGGPAAVARRELDVRPVVVDLEPAAVRASMELFGLPALVADGHRLPCATGAADAVWCLGTLCTSRDQSGLVGELVRAVRPAGPIGVMVVVATGDTPLPADTGNLFPTPGLVRHYLGSAGAMVQDTAWMDELDDDPGWDALADRVEGRVRARHGDHAAYRLARSQEDELARLLGHGDIGRLLLTARRGA